MPDEKPLGQEEAALARDAFVTRNGSQFYLDGKPFRHVGANVPELVYQPQNEVLAELDYLEAAGVRQVRVFLPNNNCTTDQTIARLRYVLDRALERDIRVTVALAHNYYQDVWAYEKRACNPGGPAKHVIRGDEGYYVPRAGDGPMVNDCPNKSGVTVCMLSDAWIDWAYQVNYKPYVNAVVSAFRDHRGVFAWDIANETNSAQPDNSYMQQATINFYRNMASAIKAADPNHLVTTGLISSHWAGLYTDANKAAVYNHASIDYVTVHTYNSDFGLLHQDDDIARANSTGYYNRPVVVEEFGKGYSAHGNNMSNVWNAVTAFYDKHYNPSDSLHVDAIVQWGVSAYDAGYDDGNGSTEHSPRYQQIASGDSGVMRRYMWHWLTWAGETDRLNGGGTEPTKLIQNIWRGDVEYQRRVPIDGSGNLNFGSARGWVAVRKQYDMPGSGPIQAYNISTYPNRVMQESVWRGDVGYYRNIPLNPGGMPNWKAAGGWGSVALSTLPGTGSYQAQDDFVYGNDQTLMQSLWRNNAGYYREVPMLNGTPNWNAAGAWGNASISAQPGSGPMQAQDDIVYPNKQTMMQGIWRGDQSFYRTVPMDASGRPNWGAASAWSGPSSINSMPGNGSGSILGQANYYTSLRR